MSRSKSTKRTGNSAGTSPDSSGDLRSASLEDVVRVVGLLGLTGRLDGVATKAKKAGLKVQLPTGLVTLIVETLRKELDASRSPKKAAAKHVNEPHPDDECPFDEFC